jgi:response regulator RpfG family c-di-GMP phosphodiesterase
VLCVLLVDDDRDFCALVAVALKDDAVDLRIAPTLEKAFEIVDPTGGGWEPDVILLDLILPDSTLVLTVQQMGRFTQKAPTIILSNHRDEDLPIALVRKGAQQFLFKVDIVSGRERPGSDMRSLRDKLMFEIKAALERNYRERPAEKILKKLRSIQWKLAGNEWDR